MKTKVFNVFVGLLFSTGLLGQTQIQAEFNTAFNNNLGIPALIGPLAGCTNWQIAGNIGGPYFPGSAIYIPSGSMWEPPPRVGCNDDIPFSGWISLNYGCFPNDPANHGCQGTVDLYYQHSFNLMAADLPFIIDLQIWADDQIVDVWVNSTNSPVWSPGAGIGTTCTSGSFKYCNWQLGNNYIIIHTRSNGPIPPSPNAWTGLRVRAYPQTLINIVGPANMCPNKPYNFSASLPGATSYNWTLPVVSPGGFSGGTTGSPVNITAQIGTPPGPYVITVSASNGTACLGIGTVQVNVWPLPNVNISASPNPACPGIPVNLNATGALTYIWQPGNSTANPLIVTPPTGNTPYTVIGTDANGCKNNKQITVTVYPPANIGISPSAPVLCAPGSVVLSGTGGAGGNYYWTGPGFNPGVIGPNITVNQPGTYTAIGISVNGCYGTAVFTLNNGNIVMPTVGNMTLCTNRGTCTLATGSTGFTGGPVTYNWYGPNNPTNWLGQGPTWNLCPPGSPVPPVGTYNYNVTATSPNGCPGSASFILTVISKCCLQSTVGLTPLTGPLLTGVSANNSFFLENNITVSGIATIQNAEVLIMPGVNITVPNGDILLLDHAHLYACGTQMWQGIVVQDGGAIISGNTANPNSMIEDAEVAIDLGGITPLHAPAPIDVRGMIFNKNHIGIKIHNSVPTLGTLPLSIYECVFSSRDMPFIAYPLPPSWPSSNVSPTGLRYYPPGTPTTGIVSPYPLLSFPQSNNIKVPHNGQSAHIGILIEDFGNSPGTPPTNGVEIGVTVVPSANLFNLFDGLGAGIEVVDASLTTYNNVFQNMRYYSYTIGGTTWFGGKGIYQKINSLMNARLDLRPSGFLSQQIDFGNRFWNCWFSVLAYDAYDVDIEYNVFRCSRLSPTVWGSGLYGVRLNSNRFDYNIKHCQFNNISYNVAMVTSTGPYDIGGPNIGTYAGNITIDENYFGPEVTSSTPLPLPPSTEYCDYAISLDGPTATTWQMMGTCMIRSNKIDRAFRGIRVQDMEDYPVTIGGNSIRINDDNLFPLAAQYGIYVKNSKDNLVIEENTLWGQNIINPQLKLIRSLNNQSISNSTSPIVQCNITYDAYVAFEFDGANRNTVWYHNDMTNHERGLELINNGEIGTQGSFFSSRNRWLGSWPWGVWHTYCNGSNPVLSPLWVMNACQTYPGFPGCGFNGPSPGIAYGTPGSLFLASTDINDCLYNGYVAPPALKTSSGIGVTNVLINDEDKNWVIDVYPNPSSGELKIKSSNEKEMLTVKIMDVTGKVVYSKNIGGSNSNTMDISTLNAAVYLIEIQSVDNKVVRKKLIKTE